MTTIPLIITQPPEERKTYMAGKSIFACTQCKSFNIENDAYLVLSAKLAGYQEQSRAYNNYRLAQRGAGDPDYNFVFIDFECSECHKPHKAFFYSVFEEEYFPQTERELLLADVTDQCIEDNIDGVYSRDVCQTFMTKLFARWQILKELTYVVVPFIGNTWQTPEERLTLLGDFLSSLHPAKTLWITRSQTIGQIKKDLNKDLGAGAYDALKNEGRLHPLIWTAKKKNASHAKFYCGFSNDSIEVLAGSHNLHGGDSMENIMFKNYDLDKFLDRYLMQINYIPLPIHAQEKQALVFSARPLSFPDIFTRTPADIIKKYFDTGV